MCIRDSNKTGSRCFYYNDQNYLINVCYIERFDWYLISLHPLNILLRDSKLGAEISLALGGILTVSYTHLESFFTQFLVVKYRTTGKNGVKKRP